MTVGGIRRDGRRLLKARKVSIRPRCSFAKPGAFSFAKTLERTRFDIEATGSRFLFPGRSRGGWGFERTTRPGQIKMEIRYATDVVEGRSGCRGSGRGRFVAFPVDSSTFSKTFHRRVGSSKDGPGIFRSCDAFEPAFFLSPGKRSGPKRPGPSKRPWTASGAKVRKRNHSWGRRRN